MVLMRFRQYVDKHLRTLVCPLKSKIWQNVLFFDGFRRKKNRHPLLCRYFVVFLRIKRKFR